MDLTAGNPRCIIYNESKNCPGIELYDTTDGTTQRSATSPVEQFTEKLDYRLEVDLLL